MAYDFSTDEAVDDGRIARIMLNRPDAGNALHELNHSHWAWLTLGEAAVGPLEHGTQDWHNAPPVQNPDPYAVGGEG